MITIKQWAAHFKSVAATVEPQLIAMVAEHAKFGGELARRYIGHEQGALTLSDPSPIHIPAWEPLAAATIDDKTDLGFGPPDWEPLYRTGQLEQSISGEGVGLTGYVGSSDPVAVFHEFGTVNMPPRPVYARAVVEIQPLLAMGLGVLGMKLLNPESP